MSWRNPSVLAPCANRLQQVLDIGKHNEDVTQALRESAQRMLAADEVKRRLNREFKALQDYHHQTVQLLETVLEESVFTSSLKDSMTVQEEILKACEMFRDKVVNLRIDYATSEEVHTLFLTAQNMSFKHLSLAKSELVEARLGLYRILKTNAANRTNRIKNVLNRFTSINLPDDYPFTYARELEGIVRKLDVDVRGQQTEEDYFRVKVDLEATAQLMQAYLTHKETAEKLYNVIGKEAFRRFCQQQETAYKPFFQQPGEVAEHTAKMNDRLLQQNKRQRVEE